MAKKTQISRKKMEFSEAGEAARAKIKQAGKILTPLLNTYIGSATVHFYANESDRDTKLYSFIAMAIGMYGMPEQMADAGHKELGRALMGYYRPEVKDKTNIQLVKDDVLNPGK